VRRQPDRLIVIAALLLASLLGATSAAAQPRAGDDDAAREQAFVEALRREDATAADRYVALRNARAQALTELRKVEAQYNGAGPDLRGLFVRPLRQAQKKYAEASLALLDFYDGRDREAVVRYRGEIDKINAMIEERTRTRAELERLLAP
jgi:hypothetical protein